MDAHGGENTDLLAWLRALSQTHVFAPPWWKINQHRKPALPNTAYRSRISAVKTRLLEEGYDACIIATMKDQSIRWAGWGDSGGSRWFGLPQLTAMLISVEGDPIIFMTRGHGSESAQTDRYITDVRAVGESADAVLHALAAELKHLRLECSRIKIVSREFGSLVEPALRQLLPRCFCDSTPDWLRGCRIRKHEQEIDLMRQAQVLGDLAVTAAILSARPGLRGSELRTVCDYAMRAGGADEQSFSLTGLARDESAALAKAGVDRSYRRYDIVFYEALPFVEGYTAESLAVIRLGRTSKEQRRATETCRELAAEIVGFVRPGLTANRVGKFMEDTLSRHGYANRWCSLGHFIGLENYEGPGLSDEIVLEPQMTLSLHPNIVIPGRVKAICGGTVVITAAGCEYLSALPVRGMWETGQAEEAVEAIISGRDALGDVREDPHRRRRIDASEYPM